MHTCEVPPRPRTQMHDTGTGEINKSGHFIQEATAPFPEALHRIDESGQDDSRTTKNDHSFMRSATAPETIDIAVATNTTWKKKSDRFE